MTGVTSESKMNFKVRADIEKARPISYNQRM